MNVRLPKNRKELEEIIEERMASQPPVPFTIGKNYIIRTILFANVGRLKKIVGKFLIMSHASWASNTGKWSECLRGKDFKSIEPFIDDIYINVDSIVDATEFHGKLPEYTEEGDTCYIKWEIEIIETENGGFQIVRSDCIGYEIGLLAEFKPTDSDLPIETVREWADEIVKIWNESRI